MERSAGLLLAGAGATTALVHTPAHAAPAGIGATLKTEAADTGTSEPAATSDTDANATCVGTGATQTGNCESSSQSDTQSSN